MKTKHFAILFGVLCFDQITKIIIENSLELYESITIIPGFFNITRAHNTGAAWSMLEGRMIFLLLVTLVALCGMYYYYQKIKDHKLESVALVLMMAGALGNFVDRIRLSYVVDFFDFIIFGYDFPVFNIADSALCIGVGLLILSMILEEVGKKHEAK